MTGDLVARQYPRWRAPLILVLKIGLAIVGIVLVLRLVRRVDWSQVGQGLSHFAWWQIGVLLVMVLIRQVFNAAPLKFLVPGLGLPRAVLNGLSGTLITTFMPPPSELVLRLAMLTSWGIEAARGVAALALNTLAFYMARFAAPVVGLVLVLLFSSPAPVYWWAALAGAAISGILIGGLAMVARGEHLAERVGRQVGRAAAKIRKKVDPEKWAQSLVKFQQESSAGLASRMAWAGLCLLGFMVVDGSILLTCLRFVGVTSAQIPYLAFMAAFLCVYPLTVFPFAGIGVLDASLIVLLNRIGVVDQPELIAALVVWRAVTLVFPLVPGLASVTYWRYSERKKGPLAEAFADSDPT